MVASEAVMSIIEDWIKRIVAKGKSFWYSAVYLAMCFGAAAIQEQMTITVGVLPVAVAPAGLYTEMEFERDLKPSMPLGFGMAADQIMSGSRWACTTSVAGFVTEAYCRSCSVKMA
ncbi:hypothetical protein AC579_10030 [Pseudocercospora musae]|uniref:Uncharacterized protein n=1 Tax=Pseudocercospora musae TaxID=113226 RepID=A0A139IH03_9PEZI|nr:hypothetical protein AC579_10030 [Pseudocercospora musae]